LLGNIRILGGRGGNFSRGDFSKGAFSVGRKVSGVIFQEKINTEGRGFPDII